MFSLKTVIEYCSEDSQPHNPHQKWHWKAIGIRSISSLFLMMCRLAQGNLCGILSQLLAKSHNSTSIFELKESQDAILQDDDKIKEISKQFENRKSIRNDFPKGYMIFS